MIKKAFTLAEILITLVVIGVVAALTIPALVDRINSKLSQNRQEVIEKRLLDGLNRYSTMEDGLSKHYETTYDFLVGLSKYYKMAQICKADEIRNCVPYDKIYYEDDEETQSKDVSTLTSIDSFMSNGADKYLEPASFITAQGIPMIMAFKKDCAWDTGKAMKDVNDSGCIAYMYDESGTRLPNKIGKDWILHGLTVKDFYLAKIGGVKIMEKAVFISASLSKAQCLTEVSRNYGITKCEWCGNDYWSAAMKYCYDKGYRLISKDESLKLANALFNYDDKKREYILNEDITRQIGLLNKDGSNLRQGYGINCYLWTSQESGDSHAYMRYIHSKGNISGDTPFRTSGGSYRAQTICVSD